MIGRMQFNAFPNFEKAWHSFCCSFSRLTLTSLFMYALTHHVVWGLRRSLRGHLLVRQEFLSDNLQPRILTWFWFVAMANNKRRSILLNITTRGRLHIVWKSPKMSHLKFSILAFFANFCPIKIDLSGNTVWPQASGLKKLAKMDHFWRF